MFVDTLVRSGAVNLVVVDSVAALTPKSELEGDMGDSHVGLQARLMSQALRNLRGSGSGGAGYAPVPVGGRALVRVIGGVRRFRRFRRFVSAPREMTGGGAPAAGACTRSGVVGDAAAGRFDVICVV